MLNKTEGIYEKLAPCDKLAQECDRNKRHGVESLADLAKHRELLKVKIIKTSRVTIKEKYHSEMLCN